MKSLNSYEQSTLLSKQYETRIHQRSVLTSQRSERQEEVNNATAQLTTAKQNLALFLKEQNMYDSIREKSALSRRDYLIVQREVNKAKGDVDKLTIQLATSKHAFAEANNRLLQLNSSMDEDARKELQKNNEELAQVNHQTEKLYDRVQRTDIKSSLHALVQGLRILNGAVVQPGDILMNLVPLDQELMVESKIATTDIGHVKVGDPVMIKVRTYDYSRYGRISGKIANISASSFTDEKGVPYYKAIIQLSQSYVGKNSKKNHLLPGMTVEANINTGSKSLLQYLLRPLNVAFSSAFHER